MVRVSLLNRASRNQKWEAVSRRLGKICPELPKEALIKSVIASPPMLNLGGVAIQKLLNQLEFWIASLRSQ